MDRTLIAGLLVGIILALVGLGAAIFCMISYGFNNLLTIVFLGVFFVGLVISGVVWSQ